MKGTRLNLRSISKLCGVSTCTVSRVLSGRAAEFRISEATAEKVLAVARKAGYRPNYLAQSLNIGRTYKIGLVFANSVDAFLGSIMEGVEARLRSTAYQMVVATCDNSPEIQDQELTRMLHRQVDGVILYPPALPQGRTRRAPAALDPRRVRTPVVVIGRAIPLESDEVMFADYEAGAGVAKHFLERGCRRFAIITHRTDCSSDLGRQQGCAETLGKNGVPSSRIAVIAEDGGPSAAALGKLAKADAAFGVNTGLLLDYVARLRDVRRMRLASVGVVQGADLMGLDLKMLVPPTREMGEQAAETLLWRLEHPRAACTQIELPMSEVVTGDNRRTPS